MCGGDLFAIDIDGGLALSDAVAKCKELNLRCIIGTSRSHQKEKHGLITDRFRIVFVIDPNTPLVVPSQVRPLFEAVQRLGGFPQDPACKDAARLFYPCQEIVYINEEGGYVQVPDITQSRSKQIQVVSGVGGQRLQLSKKSLKFIAEGAPEGSRNSPFVDMVHDAIQQQWSAEELFTYLGTNGPEWMTSPEYETKLYERYKNFVPTHPPRTTPPSAPSQKVEFLPLNAVKPYLIKWLEDHDIAVSYNRTLYAKGGTTPLLAGDVVRKVVLDISYINKAVSEKLIEYNLQEWIDEKRLAHLEAVRLDINNVDVEGGTKEIRKFLSVLKAGFNEIDVQVLRHMIWQVKRKINGLKTKHEMMLVLTGGQGAGKSTALRDYLFAPIGDLAYSAADFNALSDQREGRLFSDHYIVMFDEMSGAQKSDMERTKQIITSTVIKQRRMGTTSHDSLPMNATFFGSANNPLEMLIRDQTGMRRFYELVVDAMKDTQPRWPLLKQLDTKLLWACVSHEDEEAPIEAIMQDLRVKQEEIRDKSIVEYLLSEGTLEKTTVEGEFTSALALSHVVAISAGQHAWSAKNLAKEWAKYGIPKIRTSGGMKYGVKITDRDVIQAIQNKYGLNLKAGEF